MGLTLDLARKPLAQAGTISSMLPPQMTFVTATLETADTSRTTTIHDDEPGGRHTSECQLARVKASQVTTIPPFLVLVLNTEIEQR